MKYTIVILCYALCNLGTMRSMEPTQNSQKQYKTFRLYAPAKNAPSGVETYAGTITLHADSLKILMPGCQTAAQAEYCVNLLGDVFFHRYKAFRFNPKQIVRLENDANCDPYGYDAQGNKIAAIQFHRFKKNALNSLVAFLLTNPIDAKNPSISYGESEINWEKSCPQSHTTKLLIYLKGIDNSVCLHIPQDEDIDQIDVSGELTREEFKRLKDALSEFYNHGIDINNPNAPTVPKALNINTLRTIQELLH